MENSFGKKTYMSITIAPDAAPTGLGGLVNRYFGHPAARVVWRLDQPHSANIHSIRALDQDHVAP